MPSKNPPLNPPAKVVTFPPDNLRIVSPPNSVTYNVLVESIVIPTGILNVEDKYVESTFVYVVQLVPANVITLLLDNEICLII